MKSGRSLARHNLDIVGAPIEQLNVPLCVELCGEVIRFSGIETKLRSVPPTLLDNFIYAESDTEIVAFAKRFGPLNLPASGGHRAFYFAEAEETLKEWRDFREVLNQALVLAEAVRDAEDVPTAPWDGPIGEWGVLAFGVMDDLRRDKTTAPLWAQRTRAQRSAMAGRAVAMFANNLTSRFDLRPVLRYDAKKQRFDFLVGSATHSFGVGSALAVQFITAATGTGFTACSSCGRVFVPAGRRPAVGRRRYCERAGCGRSAAVRDAKVDFRARQRAEREAKAALS